MNKYEKGLALALVNEDQIDFIFFLIFVVWLNESLRCFIGDLSRIAFRVMFIRWDSSIHVHRHRIKTMQ